MFVLHQAMPDNSGIFFPLVLIQQRRLSLLILPLEQIRILQFPDYPLLKSRFDSLPFKWLLKIVFFNLISGILYAVLLFVMGMDHLLQEWNEVGSIGLLLALALGNLCFILLDIALARFSEKTK